MSHSADNHENNDPSKNDYSSSDKQAARAFLRERFLRTIAALTGKVCQMHTVENTIVSCEFHGCDNEADNYLVKNLKAPMFDKYSSCIIRAGDIENITFPGALKIATIEKSSTENVDLEKTQND